MRGRPGWHIECSAMAKATLGDVIDIHCGGVDLKFPHHENEIAQSCCANDEKIFAKFWVHNEFLNMDSEKMSKSLGNVTLVHDLIKQHDGEVLRLALIKAGYGSELNWTPDLLLEASEQLDSIYRALLKFPDARPTQAAPEIVQALSNNLNTPKVLSMLSQLSRDLTNRQADTIDSVKHAGEVLATGQLLGLLQKSPEDWFKGNASDDDQAEFDAIAKRREEARTRKDWAAADAARDEAKEKGIVLEDGPNGTTWRKA